MMKENLNLTKALAFMLIASIMIINVSCDKEEKGEKPDLPPVESLVMDFSDFDSRPDQPKGIETSYNNFVYSYTNVVFWSVISTGATAIPAAAYVHMLSLDAEYQGDNTWTWTYEFTYNQVDYIATLTGERVNNEEFSMEMVIAFSSTPNAGIKWFDGTIRYDHTAASWNLYKYNDMTTVKVLEVDWTMDYETDISSLKYTYVEPGQTETGSYIMFGKDPSLDYDASYDISLSTETINIQWDTTTKAGRVKNPDHFDTDGWYCWNSDLMDITCPAL